jgi:uncharacterized membrane protein
VKQQHPVIERYMTHLETAIGGLDPADRREVLQEIRNHIAEATAAGRSLDVVLESLGPADALAARGERGRSRDGEFTHLATAA